MKTGRPKRLKLEQRIELARRYHAGETPKVLSEDTMQVKLQRYWLKPTVSLAGM